MKGESCFVEVKKQNKNKNKKKPEATGFRGDACASMAGFCGNPHSCSYSAYAGHSLHGSTHMVYVQEHMLTYISYV